MLELFYERWLVRNTIIYQLRSTYVDKNVGQLLLLMFYTYTFVNRLKILSNMSRNRCNVSIIEYFTIICACQLDTQLSTITNFL